MSKNKISDECAPITTAQMRTIEHQMIASGRVSGGILMERAGRASVEAIRAKWPILFGDDLAQVRVLVLCGPGNNGGDGFVVARLLRNLGAQVWTVLFGDPEHLPVDAKTNYTKWCDMNGEGAVRSFAECDAICAKHAPHLVVDAVFGIGLNRPLPRVISDTFRTTIALRKTRDTNGRETPFVVAALDIPSGLCGDTGRIFDAEGDTSCAADLTITFHRQKHGHVTGQGPHMCGDVFVADIGL